MGRASLHSSKAKIAKQSVILATLVKKYAASHRVLPVSSLPAAEFVIALDPRALIFP